jgi:hypothetical protein
MNPKKWNARPADVYTEAAQTRIFSAEGRLPQIRHNRRSNEYRETQSVVSTSTRER